MSQLTSRDLYSGNTMMSNMASQAGSVLIEVIKPREREKAEFCEDSIEASAPVALAQNKAIALRPLRMAGIHSQHASIENSQQVGHRERSAHMSALRTVSHADDVASNLLPKSVTGRKVKT